MKKDSFLLNFLLFIMNKNEKHCNYKNALEQKYIYFQKLLQFLMKKIISLILKISFNYKIISLKTLIFCKNKKFVSINTKLVVYKNITEKIKEEKGKWRW